MQQTWKAVENLVCNFFGSLETASAAFESFGTQVPHLGLPATLRLHSNVLAVAQFADKCSVVGISPDTARTTVFFASHSGELIINLLLLFWMSGWRAWQVWVMTVEEVEKGKERRDMLRKIYSMLLGRSKHPHIMLQPCLRPHFRFGWDTWSKRRTRSGPKGIWTTDLMFVFPGVKISCGFPTCQPPECV